MTVTRVAFQTAMREASVQLVRDFAVDYDVKLQVYPGRPRTIFPPTAFVDRIREQILYIGPVSRQRTVFVDMVILHGLFDSAEAAAQKDAFIDRFADWVLDRYRAAGSNTEISVSETSDDPNYVPEWQPEAERRSYYATTVTLEGLALD